VPHLNEIWAQSNILLRLNPWKEGTWRLWDAICWEE
jgi:hypothetical protein